MTKGRRVVCFLAASILAMFLFYFLYSCDNKYTWNAPQPIAGLLILDKLALEEHPLLFPFQQWQFYPDLLLSPEDSTRDLTKASAETMAAELSSAYRKYTFIGQYSDFAVGNSGLSRREQDMRQGAGQGQGSYRLNISVPDEEREYALELPEVFSACRLYINGRLALELGEPEVTNYRPEIHSRMVTFWARDNIEIILAVSNYSHYIGGLTYPPAFGEVLAVQSVRDGRLMIRSVVCLLALFAAIFTLWAGLRLHWTRGALFSLLCLCFIGTAGYPLLHAFFPTGVQPWYAIETTCHYAMFPLVVTLHNGLCGIKGRIGQVVLIPLTGFCLLALGYSFGVFPVNQGFGQIFSMLSTFFKLLTAAWLLISSGWIVHNQTVKTTPMLIATTVYATSLLADRLWPLYEPVYGGWFGEIGSASLMVALAAMIWIDFVEAYRFRAAFFEERRYLIRQLQLQRSHYQRLVHQIEETRFLRHDLRHHMRTLTAFARKGAIEEIQAYLENMEPRVEGGDPMSYTRHLAVDAILQHFAAWAKKQGVSLTVELEIPPDVPFPDDELCIVIGNLLENALEAMERQEKGEKFLYVKGHYADKKLALVVENSFDGIIRKKRERFYSHKQDGFGMGIESIRTIVQRHGGLCDFEVHGCVFHVSVLIPACPLES